MQAVHHTVGSPNTSEPPRYSAPAHHHAAPAYYHNSAPHPAPAPRPEYKAYVDIYCPTFECLVQVPRKFINQLPAHKMNITRLVVCTNYSRAVAETGGQFTSDPKWNLEACQMGTRCKFVHVSQPLSNFPRQALHAHYIWRSLEDVTYERLWVGEEADAPVLRLVACDDCRAQCQGMRASSGETHPNDPTSNPQLQLQHPLSCPQGTWISRTVSSPRMPS